MDADSGAGRPSFGRPASWQRVGRAPLLHFLVLGATLSALWPGQPPVLELGRAKVESLRSDFEAREARPPRATELEALLAHAIDEELLLREAWASGRLRLDGTVLNRLVLLGRFVGPSEATSPEAALALARELGLDRSDPVIRRYLVERMRLALAAEADHPPPDENALATHLERHPERFEVPERLRLDHVFVSGRRGDVEGRAAALGRRLGEGRPDDASQLGDPFPRGRRLVASRAELARTFGPEFESALDSRDSGRWQGPVASAHGLHWVWLGAAIPGGVPGLAEIRSKVLMDLLQERRESHLRERLAQLRAGYEIRIAGAAQRDR